MFFRQALAYCWTVAVVGLPGHGKMYMEGWLLSQETDVHWVMRENLKKSLVKLDPIWVQEALQRNIECNQGVKRQTLLMVTDAKKVGEKMMRDSLLRLPANWQWMLVLLLLGTNACNLPASATPTLETAIELTPDTIYTEAVQTVIAQLTENAPTPIPTETETLPEATLPQADPSLPAQEETPTPPPSETPEPTPTPTMLPEPTEVSQSSDPVIDLGSPTWEDRFNPPDGWALITDSHSHFEVVDEQLVMTSRNADFWNSWVLTQPSIEVFYMEAEGTSGACAGRDRWGLFFRAPDYTQGYLFGVSCDGNYSLWVWNGSQEVYLVDWTDSPHILKGENQVNRIGVHADGNRITLYANGHYLAEVQDDSYPSGRFGLFVGAAETPGYTVKVDRIAYWENP
jgi:hypothetical protein